MEVPPHNDTKRPSGPGPVSIRPFPVDPPAGVWFVGKEAASMFKLTFSGLLVALPWWIALIFMDADFAAPMKT